MQNNDKLFEYIYEALLAEGGDGDLAVVLQLQDLNSAVDEFERFLKQKEPTSSWKREPTHYGFIVSRDMECFMFSNTDYFGDWSQTRPQDKIPCSQKVVGL
jgi:hypothetical protein